MKIKTKIPQYIQEPIPALLKALTLTGLAVVFILLWTIKSYGYCFEEAGKEYNIHPLLLYSISKVESNLNPRAINYNTDGSYDYGLMQINSRWYPSFGKTLWRSLADPCQNVRAGAWVLAGCMKKHGYTWGAVGCYHSQTRSRKIDYILKVSKVLYGFKGYNLNYGRKNKVGILPVPVINPKPRVDFTENKP